MAEIRRQERPVTSDRDVEDRQEPSDGSNVQAWHCRDGRHVGQRDVLDRGCPGCQIRRLVLADRADSATAHDVQRGPCKCGAWH